MPIVSESLESFFDETLKTACKKCPTHISEDTHSYLVSLLNLYTLSHNLFEVCENTGKFKNKVLYEKYFSFLEETKIPQKRRILKDLADTSLYMTGFFSEKLQKTLMGMNYYSQMGASSYSMLSHMSDKHQNIYKELGLNFQPITLLLRSVKKEVKLGEQETSDLLISEAFEKEACQKKLLSIKKTDV